MGKTTLIYLDHGNTTKKLRQSRRWVLSLNMEELENNPFLEALQVHKFAHKKEKRRGFALKDTRIRDVEAF